MLATTVAPETRTSRLDLLEGIQAILVHDAHDLILCRVIELVELVLTRSTFQIFLFMFGHHGIQWRLETSFVVDDLIRGGPDMIPEGDVILLQVGGSPV